MSGTQDGPEIELQRELLILVLTEDPARLSVAEVEARLGDPADVAAAMDVLIATDLVAVEGDRVVPTTAAIRFYELKQVSEQIG